MRVRTVYVAVQGSTAPFQPVETTGRFIILPTLKILFLPAEMGRNYALNIIWLKLRSFCEKSYRNGKICVFNRSFKLQFFKKILPKCCPNDYCTNYQWTYDPLHRDLYLITDILAIKQESILL